MYQVRACSIVGIGVLSQKILILWENYVGSYGTGLIFVIMKFTKVSPFFLFYFF